MGLDEMLARLLAGQDAKRRIVFREVFSRLIRNGRVTSEELATALNMPVRTVRHYLQDLAQRGAIAKGKRKEGNWHWYYTWGPEIRYISEKLRAVLKRW